MARAEVEQAAMRRALVLAATPGVRMEADTRRVGCVLLDTDGTLLAEGYHRGPGTPHAEVDALSRAGRTACGATAVVTLEPCHHTGRTGPCTEALIAAGVRRVVYAEADANPVAAGGRARLEAAGIEVVAGLLAGEAARLSAVHRLAEREQRPFVTWKLAATLDGRSAAADGTSRWISGRASRLDAHRLRATCDTMLVGTATVQADDPRLTVRDEHDEPLATQPWRVVMGERDLPPSARILDPALSGGAPSLHLRTRDPHQALAELFARDRRHVFLEGGPTLAAAFLSAGLVDEIVCYVAPVLLGAGASAVADLAVTTIADAVRPRVEEITVIDGLDGEQPDVRLRLTPAPIPGRIPPQTQTQTQTQPGEDP